MSGWVIRHRKHGKAHVLLGFSGGNNALCAQVVSPFYVEQLPREGVAPEDICLRCLRIEAKRAPSPGVSGTDDKEAP